jgi:hypothetical protein
VRTDELIGQLVADGEPVRPLRTPALRAVIWTVVAGLCVMLGVLHFGLRRDAAEAWYRTAVVLRLVLLAATAWLSVVAALRLSVPGDDHRAWSRWWPVALLGVLAALVSSEVVIGAIEGDLGSPLRAWTCMRKAAYVGAVPAILAVVLIRRATVLEPRWTALLAVLAAGSAGALTSELACPIHAPLHVLLWHLGPVAASAAIGALFGVLFWRRR